MSGPDPRTTPTDIGPTEDGSALRIRWADGHVTELSPRYLRLECRCAGCVDERTGELRLRESMVPTDVHPLAIRRMGRYALHFQWSDGHDTGIYPFELLRELCKCAECLGAE